MVHFEGLYRRQYTGNISPVSSTIHNHFQVCNFFDLMHVLDMLCTVSNMMYVYAFTLKYMMHILDLFYELPFSLTGDVMKLRRS